MASTVVSVTDPFSFTDQSLAPQVAVVSHDATRTGAPISLLNVWGELRSWSPTFLCVAGGPLVPYFQQLGPTRVLDRPSRLVQRADQLARGRISEWWERRAARRWLCAAEPLSVVYVNTITLGHVSAEAKRRGHIVVTHVHELEAWISTRIPPRRLRKALESTDVFIAASEAVKDNLVARHAVAPHVVSIVHESVQLAALVPVRTRDDVRSQLTLSSQDLLVVGVGTLDWRKGADLFVKAAIIARQRNDRIRFVWVGGFDPAVRDSYMAELEAAGQSNAVQFVGESDTPADYYNAADVFCLSSREDPYPLVMIEAAAMGLPIVAFSRAGGPSEFLASGGGLLVEHLDVSAMADALLRLAADDVMRGMLASQAKSLGAAHDAAVAAGRIAELLQAARSAA